MAARWLMPAALFGSAVLAVATAPPSPLDAFEPWLGRCWSAQVAPETRDIHCFTPMLDGAHVRDRHRVIAGGKTVYEGETIYSAEAGKISFVYVSAIGGVGHGVATPVPGGFDFAMEMRGTPDAQAEAIKSNWRWAGPTSYSVRNGDGPELMFDLDTGQPDIQ